MRAFYDVVLILDLIVCDVDISPNIGHFWIRCHVLLIDCGTA